MKVFLGGTCNDSKWRDELIPQLEIDYFNPVVEDWTPTAQTEEIHQRKQCGFVLYVITSEMTGVYSIAEAVDDSNKRSKDTLFAYLPEGFNKGQLKSLDAVAQMIRRNGGRTFTSLKDIATFVNRFKNLK